MQTSIILENHLIHGQQWSTVVLSGSRKSEQDEETEVWCDCSHAWPCQIIGEWTTLGRAATAREVSVQIQPLLCWHRVNPIKLQMPDITRLRSCPRLGDSLRTFVPLLSQTILAEFGASPFKFRPNPLRLRHVIHPFHHGFQ